ncbi:hypothetical protein N7478_007197 [Penicillium angulare]|uniref:uncharacterized protein n=1 Tax=Penicillium angulare TaxID=116970 RepID=UPI0025422DF9|nr:uncharacterized protein N7478_007197 [Penicillium angulare]KAJ5281825.1 hypothetical protein N7478_007197 [Penicillium angulare]
MADKRIRPVKQSGPVAKCVFNAVPYQVELGSTDVLQADQTWLEEFVRLRPISLMRPQAERGQVDNEWLLTAMMAQAAKVDWSNPSLQEMLGHSAESAE